MNTLSTHHHLLLNSLANSRLFTHPAVTERRYQTSGVTLDQLLSLLNIKVFYLSDSSLSLIEEINLTSPFISNKNTFILYNEVKKLCEAW